MLFPIGSGIASGGLDPKVWILFQPLNKSFRKFNYHTSQYGNHMVISRFERMIMMQHEEQTNKEG